jgi:hypothetical protein
VKIRGISAHEHSFLLWNLDKIEGAENGIGSLDSLIVYRSCCRSRCRWIYPNAQRHTDTQFLISVSLEKDHNQKQKVSDGRHDILYGIAHFFR